MIFSSDEHDQIAARWARVFMRATGITEVRINMGDLAFPSGELTWFDDHVSNVRVFRFREPVEVVDGEEVPSAAMAITMGGEA